MYGPCKDEVHFIVILSTFCVKNWNPLNGYILSSVQTETALWKRKHFENEIVN